MGIFNFRKKKKIGNTEFVHAPEEFIQFLKAEDEDMVAFGRGSLAAAGADVIVPMITLLTNKQEDIKFRRRAGHVLGDIGKPAITPLLDVLKGLDYSGRFASETIGIVAAAFKAIGKPAIEPLIQALNSEIKAVRFGAVTALVIIGDPRAIEAVRNAADNCNPEDRVIFDVALRHVQD